MPAGAAAPAETLIMSLAPLSFTPRIAIARARTTADYVESITQAGGDPWVVSREEQTVDEVLAGAEGLLLLGGDDVDPALYGEAPHEATRQAEHGRDAFEIALIRRAVETDLPLLAICRGLQVLNVALGGSLIQDIPTQHAGALAHALDPRIKSTQPPEVWKAHVAHGVAIAPGSRLAALLPEARAREVNSRHHQAVKTVGDELIVSATAPDGIIEALERPASTFLIGVQWHPENFVDEATSGGPGAAGRAGSAGSAGGASGAGGPDASAGGRFLALFRGLVRAAGARARRAPG